VHFGLRNHPSLCNVETRNPKFRKHPNPDISSLLLSSWSLDQSIRTTGLSPKSRITSWLAPVLSAGKLEVQEADCFIKQIMRGVEYMHEIGVAHRDRKPENLLSAIKGVIKMKDFGNGECFRMAWENGAHMTSGLCGPTAYTAPEEYIDKEVDTRAVDVWACGVIHMAMRTGRLAFAAAKLEPETSIPPAPQHPGCSALRAVMARSCWRSLLWWTLLIGSS